VIVSRLMADLARLPQGTTLVAFHLRRSFDLWYLSSTSFARCHEQLVQPQGRIVAILATIEYDLRMVGKAPKRIPLSDQIRQAVESSGISQYRLSKEVQIGKTSLSRFMRGERGLTLKALDRLADFLELEIVVRPKRRRKRSN